MQAAKELRLPVYYPTVRLARGNYASGERDYPAARAYKIRDRSKKRYDAYRLVLYAGEAGQYYGVQGTSLEARRRSSTARARRSRCAAASTSCSTTATACG